MGDQINAVDSTFVGNVKLNSVAGAPPDSLQIGREMTGNATMSPRGLGEHTIGSLLSSKEGAAVVADFLNSEQGRKMLDSMINKAK